MSTPEDYFEAYGTTQTYGRDRAKPTDEGNTKPYGGTSTNGCAKVRFPLVKFKELRPGTSARYLIKPIIPSFGLTLVWGKPKCGKSFWIFDAMMHVVLGWAYRGHKVRQGTVAYCALEGAEGFKARAAAYRKHHGLADDEDVPFYLMALSMDLIKDWRALVHSIQATLGNKAEVAVIVLDTVNRSLNGSESKDDGGLYPGR